MFSTTSPTVYVLDDDPAVCDSLRWLMESAELLVETFTAGPAFLDAARGEGPSCLVLDYRMPEMDGVEVLRQLRQRGDMVPAILISAHADVPSAVSAMKLGAADVVEKPFDGNNLLELVRLALQRHQVQLQRDAEGRELESRRRRLTPREGQVLELIVSGLLNKQIAAHLGLSEKTVEIHRARVMRKMEAGNSADLVRMVVSRRPE